MKSGDSEQTQRTGQCGQFSKPRVWNRAGIESMSVALLQYCDANDSKPEQCQGWTDSLGAGCNKTDCAVSPKLRRGVESFKFYSNVESYPGFSVQNKLGILSSGDTNKPVGTLIITSKHRQSRRFVCAKVCCNH